MSWWRAPPALQCARGDWRISPISAGTTGIAPTGETNSARHKPLYRANRLFNCGISAVPSTSRPCERLGAGRRQRTSAEPTRTGLCLSKNISPGCYVGNFPTSLKMYRPPRRRQKATCRKPPLRALTARGTDSCRRHFDGRGAIAEFPQSSRAVRLIGWSKSSVSRLAATWRIPPRTSATRAACRSPKPRMTAERR